MTRILQGFWPLLTFLVVVIIFAFGLTRDPNVLPSEMIDRPVPAFELTELYAPETTLTEDIFLGHISLVNVFGSWCVSCVVEHPKLMDISANQSVKLVGVDWRDTREDAKRWLAKNGNPYDVILFDGNSRLAINLGVTGAPESFLVDKAGRIRYKHTGIITEDVWDEKLWPIIISLGAEE